MKPVAFGGGVLALMSAMWVLAAHGDKEAFWGSLGRASIKVTVRVGDFSEVVSLGKGATSDVTKIFASIKALKPVTRAEVDQAIDGAADQLSKGLLNAGLPNATKANVLAVMKGQSDYTKLINEIPSVNLLNKASLSKVTLADLEAPNGLAAKLKAADPNIPTKGLDAEAMHNLHTVFGTTPQGNEALKKLYKNLGLSAEGKPKNFADWVKRNKAWLLTAGASGAIGAFFFAFQLKDIIEDLKKGNGGGGDGGGGDGGGGGGDGGDGGDSGMSTGSKVLVIGLVVVVVLAMISSFGLMVYSSSARD